MIWMISPEGGEAWQLTKSETDVGGFHWSKDGKWMAFSANPPEAKPARTARRNSVTTRFTKRTTSKL